MQVRGVFFMPTPAALTDTLFKSRYLIISFLKNHVTQSPVPPDLKRITGRGMFRTTQLARLNWKTCFFDYVFSKNPCMKIY